LESLPPTILATLIGASIDHPRNTAELIQRDILATKGAAFIDVLLIVGIVFAVLLADRVGRIRLQIFGFIGCAVGLLLAAYRSMSGERCPACCSLPGSWCSAS
jgi:MFS transporter, putative metabolite transport protein